MVLPSLRPPSPCARLHRRWGHLTRLGNEGGRPLSKKRLPKMGHALRDAPCLVKDTFVLRFFSSFPAVPSTIGPASEQEEVLSPSLKLDLPLARVDDFQQDFGPVSERAGIAVFHKIV